MFFCGGTIAVIYPLSSFVNASSLKPFASSANAPKFELEFVSEKSAPVSVTKCFVSKHSPQVGLINI